MSLYGAEVTFYVTIIAESLSLVKSFLHSFSLFSENLLHFR